MRRRSAKCRCVTIQCDVTPRPSGVSQTNINEKGEGLPVNEHDLIGAGQDAPRIGREEVDESDSKGDESKALDEAVLSDEFRIKWTSAHRITLG